MLKRAISQFALLCLVLNASAAAQSVVPDSASAIGAAKPGLFDRVISNQKKNEEALDIYERIERLEVRKNANDPAPSTVKIMRVIPSVRAWTVSLSAPTAGPRIQRRIAPSS